MQLQHIPEVKTDRATQRVAIMQPYAFPYIGYFHLIHASDMFVFYDDVNYIKRGWINRNNLLQTNRSFRFSIPISKPSQSRPINETELALEQGWIDHFRTQLAHAYRKAPHYETVNTLILSVLEQDHRTIAQLAQSSIIAIQDYLELPFKHVSSSSAFPDSHGQERSERLIHITKALGSEHYINSPGGEALYSKDYFQQHGIKLSFIQSEAITYKQFDQTFVPSLSIIDVLMFNEPEQARALCGAYTLK